MWASVILVSGVAMVKKPNVATKPPSSVSETPSVFGLNPNGKITGKYQLSISYGNLCVISAIIGDLPVRHQRGPPLAAGLAGWDGRAGLEQCCHGAGFLADHYCSPGGFVRGILVQDRVALTR